MIAENIKLKYFRLTVFPFIMVLELILSVLFLVLPYFNIENSDRALGYQLFLGWLLFILSVLAFVLLLLLFLSSFSFKNSKFSALIGNDRNVQTIAYTAVLMLYSQIISLGITQQYQALFIQDFTPLYSLILGFSLLVPVILYFAANIESESESVYAFSKVSLLRFKLTAFWMFFLTGALQLFSTEWSIIFIGLMFLITSFLFFFLYRYSIVLTPIVLIVHFAFSSLMAVLSLRDIPSLLEDLNTSGLEVSFAQAIALSVFFLIVPAIISIVLAQSFFRKWIFAWVREVNPEPEMEITPPFEDD